MLTDYAATQAAPRAGRRHRAGTCVRELCVGCATRTRHLPICGDTAHHARTLAHAQDTQHESLPEVLGIGFWARQIADQTIHYRSINVASASSPWWGSQPNLLAIHCDGANLRGASAHRPRNAVLTHHRQARRHAPSFVATTSGGPLPRPSLSRHSSTTGWHRSSRRTQIGIQCTGSAFVCHSADSARSGRHPHRINASVG